MRTINYQSFFDFGKGVDSVSESACGQAVEITTATTIQGAGGQRTEFRLDIIESQTQFQKALGISSSASLRYGLASVYGANVDAKFQFAEDNTFSEYNLNVLARVFVQNPVLILQNPKLRPEVEELYIRDIKTFQNRFGDSFVSGLHTGGEFFGLIIIETRDTTTKETIYANLTASGAFGAWGGSFGIELKSEQFQRTGVKNTRVSIIRSGGSGSISSDVNGMIQMAKDFPNAVAAIPEGRGWPYQVDLTEYKFLDLPVGANIIDIERQRELFTYLGKQRSDALVKLKKCQYVRANPQEFMNVTPEVLQRLGESEQQLLAVVDSR